MLLTYDIIYIILLELSIFFYMSHDCVTVTCNLYVIFFLKSTICYMEHVGRPW